MSGREDKTPDQIIDEDYKTGPTSADRDVINKESATTEKKRLQEADTPSEKQQADFYTIRIRKGKLRNRINGQSELLYMTQLFGRICINSPVYFSENH